MVNDICIHHQVVQYPLSVNVSTANVIKAVNSTYITDMGLTKIKTEELISSKEVIPTHVNDPSHGQSGLNCLCLCNIICTYSSVWFEVFCSRCAHRCSIWWVKNSHVVKLKRHNSSICKTVGTVQHRPTKVSRLNNASLNKCIHDNYGDT